MQIIRSHSLAFSILLQFSILYSMQLKTTSTNVVAAPSLESKELPWLVNEQLYHALAEDGIVAGSDRKEMRLFYNTNGDKLVSISAHNRVGIWNTQKCERVLKSSFIEPSGKDIQALSDIAFYHKGPLTQGDYQQFKPGWWFRQISRMHYRVTDPLGYQEVERALLKPADITAIDVHDKDLFALAEAHGKGTSIWVHQRGNIIQCKEFDTSYKVIKCAFSIDGNSLFIAHRSINALPYDNEVIEEWDIAQNSSEILFKRALLNEISAEGSSLDIAVHPQGEDIACASYGQLALVKTMRGKKNLVTHLDNTQKDFLQQLHDKKSIEKTPQNQEIIKNLPAALIAWLKRKII